MAALTTLRLLRQLPPGAAADVRCVSFAAPAIGNARLQAYVRERGWERHFSNLLVPGAGRVIAQGHAQDVALCSGAPVVAEVDACSCTPLLQWSIAALLDYKLQVLHTWQHGCRCSSALL